MTPTRVIDTQFVIYRMMYQTLVTRDHWYLFRVKLDSIPLLHLSENGGRFIKKISKKTDIIVND